MLLKGEKLKGRATIITPMVLSLPKVDSKGPSAPVGKAIFKGFSEGVATYEYTDPDGNVHAITRDPGKDKIFRGIPIAFMRDCMNALNRT